MQLKKKLVWSAMFTATLGLTACGGSSGGSSSAVGSLSGIVADGYLGNATVCLDLNKNKLCDDNEPSAITEDGTGAYTIEAMQAQIDSTPVLVITTTQTTDSDLGGATIENPFTLSAPAGKGGFISPLTTKVQAKIEATPGMTVEEAELAVKSDLGLTNTNQVSLFEDFVEKGQDGDDDYKALHQTSQAIARVMGDLKANWGTDLTPDDEAFLQRRIIEEVVPKLKELHASAVTHIESTDEVDVVIAQSEAESVVATAPPAEAIAIEIENDRADDEAVNNTAPTTLSTAVTEQNGLALMQYDFDSTVVGIYATIFVNDQNGGIAMYQSDAKWNDIWLSNMQTEQDVKEDFNTHSENYSVQTMTLSADGTATFLGRDGDATVQIQEVKMVDFNGLTKPLKEVSMDYQGDPSKTVTFAEGDINYQLPFIETPMIKSKTLSELCPTIAGDDEDINNQACYYLDGGALASDFTPNSAAVNEFLSSEFGYYFKDNATYSCTAQTDAFGVLRDENNQIICQEGTERRILIKGGTLVDGNRYILLPESSFNEEKQRYDIVYDLYIADGNTRVLALSNFVSEDAEGEIVEDIYSAYNLSAIKRIHEAAAQ